MRRDVIRFGARLRIWFYGVFGLLFLSGALWFVFHRFVKVSSDFGPAAHPLEKWWLAFHGGAAMDALVLLGVLIPFHIRRGWIARRNRISGSVIVTLCLALTLSGYGLYYLSSEGLRASASWLHVMVGFAMPPLLICHILVGRTSRGGAIPKRSQLMGQPR